MTNIKLTSKLLAAAISTLLVACTITSSQAATQTQTQTPIYKALSDSKDPAKTIAELLTLSYNPETITYIAAVLGVGTDAVEAGLTSAHVSSKEVSAWYEAGLDSLYKPDEDTNSSSNTVSQFSSSTSSSLSSVGGGGAVASHN
jgi:hypothetical protein